MERNTSTTLGELKKGDRFYVASDKKKTVFEVMEEKENARLYNRINAYGYKMERYDTKGMNEKSVIFLRHKND